LHPFVEPNQSNPRPKPVSTPLDKEDIVFFATRRLLLGFVTGIDDQTVSRAARILLDLRIKDIELAKETIEALEPGSWLGGAIANRLLRVLENLLYDGRIGDEHNPRAERYA
jgi:hypothetical protein